MTQPEHGGTRYLIPHRDDLSRGLGRHVNHDPRSRQYPFRTQAATLTAVYHQRHVPIFDQGQLGSCEGNATLGLMATGPYWSALTEDQQRNGLAASRYPWNEDGAKQLYSDITADDDFDGQWPPTDTGSDGLSAAKELVKRSIIDGYQHTFSLPEALAALQQFPLLMGTNWLDGMFNPDSYGRIRLTGPVDGGHAWILDEYVPAGLPAASTGDVLSKSLGFVGGTTSWGTSFGAHGRFFLSAPDLGSLLGDDGDAIVPALPAAPKPQPDPGDQTTCQKFAAGIRKLLDEFGL